MLILTIVNLLLLIAVLFEVDWTVQLRRPGAPRPLRLGFSHDCIMHGEEGGASGGSSVPYMERWILWLPGWARGPDGHVHLSGITLRVHKFWRGDDDSAPHDHPWWFYTLPLTTYVETYYDFRARHFRTRQVRAFRLHFRPAHHRHIVYMPARRTRPFYTLVVSGGWGRRWGFWPEPTKFVYWRDWVRRQQISGDEK